MSRLCKKVFRFADRKDVALRHFIAIISVVLLLGSAISLGIHAALNTEWQMLSGYALVAMVFLVFSVLLLGFDKIVINWVTEGKRSFITPATGKFLNLTGPLIGVVLSYFFSEKVSQTNFEVVTARHVPLYDGDFYISDSANSVKE